MALDQRALRRDRSLIDKVDDLDGMRIAHSKRAIVCCSPATSNA
jgi:hypothetical protein